MWIWFKNREKLISDDFIEIAVADNCECGLSGFAFKLGNYPFGDWFTGFVGPAYYGVWILVIDVIQKTGMNDDFRHDVLLSRLNREKLIINKMFYVVFSGLEFHFEMLYIFFKFFVFFGEWFNFITHDITDTN
jgi:hypothetical protein